MNVKLGDLLLGAKALNEFVDSADLDTGEHVKLDWRLGHNARKSAVEVRAFEEKRSKIQDKHVRKDKDGNPVPVTKTVSNTDGNSVEKVVEGQVYLDDPVGLNSSIVALLDVEIDVDIHPIPLSWFEGTGGETRQGSALGEWRGELKSLVGEYADSLPNGFLLALNSHLSKLPVGASSARARLFRDGFFYITEETE